MTDHDKPVKFDARTREGQERAILERVRDHGALSVFWITCNQKRAHAMSRVEASKRVQRNGDDPRDAFPVCIYSLTEAGRLWLAAHERGDRP